VQVVNPPRERLIVFSSHVSSGTLYLDHAGQYAHGLCAVCTLNEDLGACSPHQEACRCGWGCGADVFDDSAACFGCEKRPAFEIREKRSGR
jgi:hypothetical protein